MVLFSDGLLDPRLDPMEALDRIAATAAARHAADVRQLVAAPAELARHYTPSDLVQQAHGR